MQFDCKLICFVPSPGFADVVICGFADVVICGALHNPVKKIRCRGLLLYVWVVGRLSKGGRLSLLGDRLLTSCASAWKTIMRFPRILNAPQVP
eukprot:COSAG05_NODE_7707_length_777_cov_1.730088_1_plen_93_part_00